MGNENPCPYCGTQQIIRNGHKFTMQSYKCKLCGRQFTKEVRHTEKEIAIAIYLHSDGLSNQIIAKIMFAKPHTVSAWIKQNVSQITLDWEEVKEYINSVLERCGLKSRQKLRVQRYLRLIT